MQYIVYVIPVIAGIAFSFSCQYCFQAAQVAKGRGEVLRLQQGVDALRVQVESERQQLQAQQDKFDRASAVSAKIGPAVVVDVQAAAEKTNNPRLRELLKKYGAATSEAVAQPTKGKEATK
jgi:hypothetical protein